MKSTPSSRRPARLRAPSRDRRGAGGCADPVAGLRPGAPGSANGFDPRGRSGTRPDGVPCEAWPHAAVPRSKRLVAAPAAPSGEDDRVPV
ncbi:MAG: hypothetical protein ACK5TE_16410, partial [Pseudomonadota bacterium]